MRVAERRKHTTKVCRNVLHNEGENHMLFFLRAGKDNIAEREKGQKRHVVCNQHRADKRYVHKRENRSPRRFKQLNRLLRKEIKEVYVFQRAYDSEYRKQTGEGA